MFWLLTRFFMNLAKVRRIGWSLVEISNRVNAVDAMIRRRVCVHTG
jgi:hypothetical protein